jgi:glycosyltransferase involved in cell wall biosynthesis
MIEMLKKDREKMRQNSIKLASKYDWSSIAKQFKIFFEEIINE